MGSQQVITPGVRASQRNSLLKFCLFTVQVCAWMNEIVDVPNLCDLPLLQAASAQRRR